MRGRARASREPAVGHHHAARPAATTRAPRPCRSTPATGSCRKAWWTDRGAAIARQLCTMRQVAETSAAVFAAELVGTRSCVECEALFEVIDEHEVNVLVIGLVPEEPPAVPRYR